MPKYTLICHNKKRSKYFGILNMSDAVAYCIYPSIFRHLQYSEPEAYSEPWHYEKLGIFRTCGISEPWYIQKPVKRRRWRVLQK